jgi:type VI secretion system protein ImpE
MTAEQQFAAGNLSAAVQAAIDDVKKKPTELGPRWRLAEFLCLTGDLERADKQLETVLVQFPQQGPGISQFRNLLRGEYARREIAEQGRVPEFLTEPTDSIRASLAALVALRAGDTAEAAKQTAAAEASRAPLTGTADGRPFDDLRDLDDVLGGVLEVITGAGECAWIPLAHIASIQFAKPSRSRDLLWREAAVTLHDGEQVNCFVPMIYSGTHKAANDALKLGRATEWNEPAEGVARGIGQRMWLVGEDVKPVLEISEIAIASQK